MHAYRGKDTHSAQKTAKCYEQHRLTVACNTREMSWPAPLLRPSHLPGDYSFYSLRQVLNRLRPSRPTGSDILFRHRYGQGQTPGYTGIVTRSARKRSARHAEQRWGRLVYRVNMDNKHSHRLPFIWSITRARLGKMAASHKSCRPKAGNPRASHAQHDATDADDLQTQSP